MIETVQANNFRKRRLKKSSGINVNFPIRLAFDLEFFEYEL